MRRILAAALQLCLIALMGSLLIQPAEARQRHARTAGPLYAAVSVRGGSAWTMRLNPAEWTQTPQSALRQMLVGQHGAIGGTPQRVHKRTRLPVGFNGPCPRPGNRN